MSPTKKSSLKKFLRILHRWLGLTTGAMVFIIAVTGCVYAFYYEIKPLVYQDRLFISPSLSERLPVSALLEAATKAVGDEVPCQRALVPTSTNETAAFTFQQTDREGWFYPDYMQVYKTVYVNPYSAEIVHIENTKWEFFNVVFWIHTCLFFGYFTLGNHLVTWVTIAFIIMMLSGLMLWWPKKKNLGQNLRFQWKASTRWRRKNYDLHKILGFYVFSLALLAATTGLFWASENFNHAVQWAANGGKEVDGFQLKKTKSIGGSEGNSLDIAFDKTLKMAPKTTYALLRFVPSVEAPIIIRAYLNDDPNYKREVYYFDKSNAELIGKETFGQKNNGEKIAALNYDLHVGSIIGLPGKILAFIGSLIVASLSVTGPLIWMGRKR